jgi:peptidoglycan/xylan/chitin deacetylase (PgdA/CDA1 family)
VRADTGTTPLLLMYHSVAEYTEDPFLVTVTPQRFEQQMRWLARNGYRGTSVRELLAAVERREAHRMVGLTFDDGYSDFATTVVPILERFGFNATVYVLADRVGGHNDWESHGPRKPLMTLQQLRQVADAGFEIGSHGLRHVVLPEVRPDELTAEVAGSRELLENLTGHPVTGFTYPFGHVTVREVEAVRAAGYDYGCAIWRSELTGRHTLPRTYVGQADGVLRLLAKRARHVLRDRGVLR